MSGLHDKSARAISACMTPEHCAFRKRYVTVACAMSNTHTPRDLIFINSADCCAVAMHAVMPFGCYTWCRDHGQLHACAQSSGQLRLQIARWFLWQQMQSHYAFLPLMQGEISLTLEACMSCTRNARPLWSRASRLLI